MNKIDLLIWKQRLVVLTNVASSATSNASFPLLSFTSKIKEVSSKSIITMFLSDAKWNSKEASFKEYLGWIFDVFEHSFGSQIGALFERSFPPLQDEQLLLHPSVVPLPRADFLSDN